MIAAGYQTVSSYEEAAGLTRCGACYKESDKIKLLLCAGCKKEAYCSKACQKWHWKDSHKKEFNDKPRVMALIVAFM